MKRPTDRVERAFLLGKASHNLKTAFEIFGLCDIELNSVEDIFNLLFEEIDRAIGLMEKNVSSKENKVVGISSPELSKYWGENV